MYNLYIESYCAKMIKYTDQTNLHLGSPIKIRQSHNEKITIHCNYIPGEQELCILRGEILQVLKVGKKSSEIKNAGFPQ